jgi:hypothetical protein
MATRHVIERLSGRIDRLAAHVAGPLYIFGETRARAERSAAEHLAKHPQDAGRPIRLICWEGDEELWQGNA